MHDPSFAIDPPSGARLPHYLAAMLLVGCALAGAGHALERAAPLDTADATQDAILVDMPPAETGVRPPGDGAPPQQAVPAAANAPPPPPKPEVTEPPKPAIVEIPKPPPPQPVAQAAAPQAAHEAGGPQAAPGPDAEADEAASRYDAHLITLWQKALMARLQAARHGLPHHERIAGLAKIAFEIDRAGHLVSERVALGSGSADVDAAALALVRLAAPYPAPPRDAGTAQLAFVVPISFKR